MATFLKNHSVKPADRTHQWSTAEAVMSSRDRNDENLFAGRHACTEQKPAQSTFRCNPDR